MDIGIPTGMDILASADGKVIRVQKIKKGYGKNIIIYHENGYSTLYAHLNKILVKKGDVVKKGDIIGTSGNTGLSTGPHLHFEIRHDGVPLNPRLFIL